MTEFKFKYTDSILQSLNELTDQTLFGLNLPNKLDTGLYKSTVAQAGMDAGKGWVKSALGQSIDPGEINTWATRFRHKDYATHYFSAIRSNKVRLLQILLEAGQTLNVSEAISGNNSANYQFLFEAHSGMYQLQGQGGEFFQMFGDSQSVVVIYKVSYKAAVIDAGNYGNFLCNSNNTYQGDAGQYIANTGDIVLDKTRQHALTMFKSSEDAEFITEFLSEGLTPPVFVDAVAMGVIDTANIPVKSVKAPSIAGKYVVTGVLRNTESIIINAAKSRGQLTDYGVLPETIRTDIAQKLSELDSDPGPYGDTLRKLQDAFDMTKKNPIRTYGTIWKGCISALNWMLVDLKSIISTSSRDANDVFFGNAPVSSLGDIPLTDDHFGIAVVKALNRAPFPLQIRCLTSQLNKKSRQVYYENDPRKDKLITILPGFNNYITSKLDTGSTDGEAYVRELCNLPVTESTAFRGNVEDPTCIYKAITRLYVGGGKFNEAILFKHLPPFLSQCDDADFEILTSMTDLRDSSLPYVSKLSDSDKGSERIRSAEFPTKMAHAVHVTFNPINADGAFDSNYSKDTLLNTPATSPDILNLQYEITKTFIPLSQIRSELLVDLDKVVDYKELLEVGNKLSVVIQNLAHGFWAIDGNCESAKLLNSTAGKQLGFYNLLASKKGSNTEELSGAINMNLLSNAHGFRKYRDDTITTIKATI